MLKTAVACALVLTTAWCGESKEPKRNQNIIVVEDRPIDLELIFPENYDKDLPPKRNDSAVEVSVCFLPAKIMDISLTSMTVRIATRISVHWSDQRVIIQSNSTLPKYGTFYLNSYEKLQLWTPLLTLRNAVSEGILSSDTRYYAGHFFFEVRTTPTFHCHLDLTSYPMDVQHCTIQVQALNYKSSVVLKRYVRIYEFTSKTDPQEFRIMDINTGNCWKGDHFERYYSCTQYSFKLKRQIGSHLILTFLPSWLIVALSWVSFWLDAESSSGPRVTLCITTMLTLTTQFRKMQHELPKVSYLKAVDIWMLTCMFMIFGALIEFTIAYANPKKFMQPSRRPLNSQILENFRPKLKWSNPVFQVSHSPVDRIARHFFPLFFICFNLVYWCYYGL